MRIDVRTSKREEFVDVTRTVAQAVAEGGIGEGVAFICCPHTTAGVALNEHADPDVACDVLTWLGRSCPLGGGWRHVEGNADAHVKAVLVGASVAVPVSGGSLNLGTWQGVFFCEFDGPRNRHLEVRVLGG